jgi:hypothetical protein
MAWQRMPSLKRFAWLDEQGTPWPWLVLVGRATTAGGRVPIELLVDEAHFLPHSAFYMSLRRNSLLLSGLLLSSAGEV